MSPASEIRLSLPWPDKRLSPNAREHHFARSRAAKKARRDAWGVTLAATGASSSWAARGVSLQWQFCPPSRRRYDIDNLVAQHKAAQDGIADALGCDDSKFLATYVMGEPIKGGCVNVTISQIETEAERFARMEPVLFAGMKKGTP